MHRSSAPLRAVALAVLILFLPSLAPAQSNVLYDLKVVPGGDLQYRTLLHLEYRSELAPPVVLVPGFGLSGATFRRRVGGEPGWGKLLKERGYSAWMLDNVGVGDAQRPPDLDLDKIFEFGMFGIYQAGLANAAALAILHEQAAGMGLRARSFSPRFADALVLIDPIGPQGAQPRVPFDPAERLAERMDPDHLWQEWGFGPERGVVRDDLDLSAAQAESLYAGYDRTQPPYWVGLLTGWDTGFAVGEPMLLSGVPVLVVRTPAADAAQIERENAVVRWMLDRGMVVETWDLSQDEELRHVSGLPWAGELAPRVLDAIMTWYENLTGARQPVGR